MLSRDPGVDQDHSLTAYAAAHQGGGILKTNASGAHGPVGAGRGAAGAAGSHAEDFAQFSLPSVRTRFGSGAAGASGHAGGSRSFPLLLTPYAADPLNQWDSIYQGVSSPAALHDLLNKPEFLSPDLSSLGNWGLLGDTNAALRLPRAHTSSQDAAAAVEAFLQRASELQERARKLWEMENAELDRGARLRILESMAPAGEQQPSTALGTQAHLRNSCSAFSPNSRALWHTYSSMSMQAMSPSCFVDVHLLDNTPTKSSMVDL